MFSLPVQTMKGTVCFLTFGYYQLQINENCLSKHPVRLADSLYVCIIDMTYCEPETLRILEQFNYLQQPLLVGDGKSLCSAAQLLRAAIRVPCRRSNISEDGSAPLEVMTKGKCLTIWRPGHEEAGEERLEKIT